MTTRYAIFDTAIGPCAIMWGDQGIIGSQLPLPSERQTRLRVLQRFPDAEEGAPPPDIANVMASVQALLNGEARDLSDVALDMSDVPEFNQQVYALARRIPPGATKSYGDIASELGDATIARAIGQAMGQNPFAPIVPCHRVVGANGKPGGFSASGGLDTKLRMLTIEKARLTDVPSLFDDLPYAARPRG